MEEQYTQEQLDQFDEIINRLSKGRTINVYDYPQSVYAVLANKGWISSKNRYSNFEFFAIIKGRDFDRLLIGGTFSERYYREL